MKSFKSVFVVTFLSLGFMCTLPVISQADMMAKESMKAGAVMGTDMKAEPAIGGFCPTCLIHGMKMMGTAEYTTVYEGKTYMFSTGEMKKAFDENPAENAKEAQMKFDAMKTDAMATKDGMMEDGMMKK